ncbi:carnitine dehydratase [Hahella sp. CCB-MM4]|uniref:CaiB/BaiF CoA transferase family protein n=1 Tax=Hahella sp. (strain CCB-MM4) TaxID=1926491 RepID=UPI000B9A4544|nr:CaiB/BaiF CoA-transferase family protein [Hahella sp. CCB-MM4]OZG72716.1 carnitine dehydratase [Hahella sp. CCB-MM4]
MPNKTFNKPLQGLLVVSIEQALAAPLCTSRLADAGARVIKIEREEGDFARGYDSVVNGESSYFVWTNRGKESVVLDLKSDQGLATLRKLLERADVFIHNLAPGATKRLGVDSATIRKELPRLITCDISGYGDEGEYRDMKAYDLLIQSESGLVSVSGAAEGYGRIGVSICDIGAGMNALIGIQQALLKRDRTGQGSSVKVSLFDGAVDWMSVPILHQKYAGKGPERVGLKHPSIAPYGEFMSQDGKAIVLSIQNNREWAIFCANVLEAPELALDERFATNNQRVEHRQELDRLISDRFAQIKSNDLRELLRRNGIAFGSVNSTADLMSHPQIRYTTVSTPSGPAEIIAPPVVFAGEPIDLGAVPALGEHTQQILEEFQ